MSEVLDPVHGFIMFDEFEKAVIDSAPVQRLRDIHQLAMEFMVYPGATHKRFEHSLGVMHLAGRVFDSLFAKERLIGEVEDRLGAVLESGRRKYWRQIIRLAGLLHDVGHLPFSHTGEGLLEAGVTHEHVTRSMIEHGMLRSLLSGLGNEAIKDTIDCCISPRKRETMELEPLDEFKAVINELITGDAFGVDRMDYLLRDALFTGAVYGRFDIERLLACLELVVDEEGVKGTAGAFVVGVNEGGLHAAESLLLARYFMYEQVYFHDVRRAYDCHLTDFLMKWRQGSPYPSNAEQVLALRDGQALTRMWEAYMNDDDNLHSEATRIIKRQHYRTVYRLTARKRKKRPDVFETIHDRLTQKLTKNQVHSFREESGEKAKPSFVVKEDDSGKAVAADSLSEIVRAFPKTDIGFLFCPVEVTEQANGIISEVEKGSSS